MTARPEPARLAAAGDALDDARGMLAPGWNAIGPSPPAIQAPIGVDLDRKTIYMGAFGAGILKSANGGDSFAFVNGGLPPTLAVTALAVDAVDSDHAVVGALREGLWQTSDGGASWWASNIINATVTCVAMAPSDPRVVYAGLFEAVPLRRSSDGGRIYVAASTGIPVTSVWGIAVDPRDANVAYVATAGQGAWKTVDGGARWAPMPTPEVVWSVAVDPCEPDTIYVGSDRNGILQSCDGGGRFHPLGGPDGGAVLAVAVDPRDRKRRYAGSISSGIVESRDGGNTWRTLHPAMSASLHVDRAGTVYAGTATAGALRRPIDGEPVALAGELLFGIKAQSVYAVTIDPLDRQRLLLATNDGGLRASIDGGATWTDSGRGFGSRAARRVVFDPRDPNRAYAGSFFGGGLHESHDGGRTWTRHRFGPADVYSWATAVDPRTGAVYAGTLGAGLWRRLEGGPFKRIDGGRIQAPRDLTFSPELQGAFLVAARTGIFRSVDSGASFDHIVEPSTSSIGYDPFDARFVFAGTDEAGVWRSIDGGRRFAPANVGLGCMKTSRGGALAFHPTQPGVLFLGTEGGGVFRSDDRGEHWRPVNRGLGNLAVSGLTIDRERPDVLYVAGASGVWKTETAGA